MMPPIAAEFAKRAARWFVRTPVGLAVLLELARADDLVSRNLLEFLAQQWKARLEYWE